MDHQIPVLEAVVRPVWASLPKAERLMVAMQAFHRLAWEDWAEEAQAHRLQTWAIPDWARPPQTGWIQEATQAFHRMALED